MVIRQAVQAQLTSIGISSGFQAAASRATDALTVQIQASPAL